MKRTVSLNNDIEMPLLGLGLYDMTFESEVVNAVNAAVRAGYRLFDTASSYKNEDALGKAIQRCGVSRKELFITTKVWNTAQTLGDIEGAFQRSLERLRLSYVDLYLIHWPVPGCYGSTWRQLEKLYEKGYIKAIGVSNFDVRHLEQLRQIAHIVPAVNQIELHPLWYQKQLLEYCQENGIQVQASAPLARGAYLDNDIICVLATKYVRTPAQIGLRWALQKGAAVIPKSSVPDRIRSNADIFDFEIAPEDMAIIDTMNQNYRASQVPADLKDIPW